MFLFDVVVLSYACRTLKFLGLDFFNTSADDHNKKINLIKRFIIPNSRPRQLLLKFFSLVLGKKIKPTNREI